MAPTHTHTHTRTNTRTNTQCPTRWSAPKPSVLEDPKTLRLDRDPRRVSFLHLLAPWGGTNAPGLSLHDVPHKLRSDPAVARAALGRNGLELRFVRSYMQRWDKDLVLLAVSENGMALRHVAPELQEEVWPKEAEAFVLQLVQIPLKYFSDGRG